MSIRRSFLIILRISVIFLLLTFIQFDAVIITEVYAKAEVTQDISQKSWNQTYGGDSFERAASLIQTLDGGFALAGITEFPNAGTGSTEFYIEMTADMWLVKTDDKGVMQWNQSYGETGWEEAHSVIQTGDEGFALVGVAESYVTEELNMWLIKTDKHGIALWNQSYGGVNSASGEALIQTIDGGFALTGKISLNLSDMWLVKTDDKGIMQWNQSYGGTRLERSYDLIQTMDGGFALAGYTSSYGVGEYDMWLVKTDANGEVQWSQTYGGTSYDQAYTLLQTPDGGFVLAGETESWGNGFADMLLVKTDPNGVLLWYKTYGGPGFEYAHALIQTLDGGFALVGSTTSYGAGSRDMWFVKTDIDGLMQWNKAFGGTGYDYASALLQTPDGGFVIAGSVNNGDQDMWLVKIPRSTSTIPTHVIFSVFVLGGLGALILIILYYQRRKT